MARLNEFISDLDLSGLISFIETYGNTVSLRRGEMLCEEGRVCNVVAIVRSGYLKYSVTNSKGETGITGFSFEGEVAGDFPGSFIFGKPSFTAISAGCDSEITRVDVDKARRYMVEHHADFIAHLSSVLLLEAYRRYIDLHSKTPQERYVALIMRCHNDLSHIPLHEIASYLSISRRQLLRIREKHIKI